MPCETSPAAGLVWAALPLVLSFLVNMAEAAAVYFDDAELRHLTSSGNKKAGRLTRLLKRHSRVELSAQLATALCLAVSAGFWLSLFGPAAQPGFSPSWAGWLAGIVWTALFVALGVAAPRMLAGYFPQQAAFFLLGLLGLTEFVLTPAVVLIEVLAGLPLRLAGRNPASPPHSITEEEIRMLVDEGEERGAIEGLEKEMINSIFEFDDRDVSEAMTHRTEVSALPLEATLDEVVALAMQTGYSRIPVYSPNIDSICGILYVKDLLKYLNHPEDFSLAREIRRPLYVHESSSCADVFALLQREKTQIAVVIDEYGGTYGIITMEDLLETIVGSIQDEYDDEQSPATQVEEGVYLLDGSMGLFDAERLLGLHVPDDSDADTLGGFVTELLGGVPRGEDAPRTASFDGVTFTVVQADERRIGRIRAAVKR
jgi:putative hemolysin